MNSIKLHVFVGENDGTESCDFRGDKKIGSAEGDEHKTLAEIDPADDDLVDIVLTLGPKLNKVLSRMINSKAIGSILDVAGKLMGTGTKKGLRIGVWDGDGRV